MFLKMIILLGIYSQNQENDSLGISSPLYLIAIGPWIVIRGVMCVSKGMMLLSLRYKYYPIALSKGTDMLIQIFFV
jgi:hypothetical protein